ncbi:MAG: ATP-binding cassette domain-containing protein [Clostridia bacterium]|nr:ATP-binding cassette domain-containing protein [Clostridia bacterium]
MKIIAENIVKTIKKRIILDNINLELESGNIYGFVGRNGCGKTMLFRALSGLMHIDSGRITIDGKVLHKDINVPPSIGLIIENAGLYNEFSGFKNLKLLADINKIISDTEITKAISDVGLDPNDKRPVRKYSLGMKQRLIIAQAIMESPDIIMLDEPTNALDERGVKLIRDIILREKERGALVLIASHNKEDIEILADRVYYMDGGKIVGGKDYE